MIHFVNGETFEQRLRASVSVAWEAFARKVGNGSIAVHKEASMQLQYAYLLKHLLPLALHAPHEKADVELETGVRIPDGGTNNVDILLKATSNAGESSVAIELKCYRNIASSGEPRGAQDIFMKDVYEDLQILEKYTAAGIATRGVALVMTDLKRLVQPAKKIGKCWHYDTSHGTVFSGGEIRTSVGGKQVRINLRKTYKFDWTQVGSFWFLELEGTAPNVD